MHVTAEQLRQQQAALGIEQWRIRDCSICGYPTAYLFEGGYVFFDAGCWCSSLGVAPPTLRAWEDVANHVNIQTSPEVIAQYCAFWGLTEDAS